MNNERVNIAFSPPNQADHKGDFSQLKLQQIQSQKMKTLVNEVTAHYESAFMGSRTETCIVMTRRIRWLFITRSRTTVFPGSDCRATPPFIVWWNSDDPEVLKSVHAGMVKVIEKIGFTEPAVWCDNRYKNANPNSLNYFWQEKLGELFRHYRKAT